MSGDPRAFSFLEWLDSEAQRITSGTDAVRQAVPPAELATGEALRALDQQKGPTVSTENPGERAARRMLEEQEAPEYFPDASAPHNPHTFERIRQGRREKDEILKALRPFAKLLRDRRTERDLIRTEQDEILKALRPLAKLLRDRLAPVSDLDDRQYRVQQDIAELFRTTKETSQGLKRLDASRWDHQQEFSGISRDLEDLKGTTQELSDAVGEQRVRSHNRIADLERLRESIERLDRWHRDAHHDLGRTTYLALISLGLALLALGTAALALVFGG